MKKHKHHIIPKHAGGTDDESNIIKLSIEEHAEAHKKLFEEYNRWQDKVAWLGLSGLISCHEARYTAVSESMKGENNPMFGKPAPNRGVKRPGVGGRKKGTKWSDEERRAQEISRSKPGHYDYLKTEERSIRNSGENNPMFGKPGANTGKTVYNNGTDEQFFIPGEQPPGFVLGRIPGITIGVKKGLRWYNDGSVNRQFREGQQPEGFINGRTRKK